jgi:nucleoside-diphosphate-sugar epimerase
MKHVVITGITGHVGPVLGRQLVKAGFEVHGLTRQKPEPAAVEDVYVHTIDGRTQTLVALFEEIQPDIVVHLAALARREHLTADVTPFVTANILFGTQLLEAARVTGCRSFITAGSYLQHAEDGRHHAFNLYAATKIAYEQILNFFVDAYDFSVVMLTLCNIYSEWDLRPTLLSQMVEAYADGTPLSLHSGQAWVDLVHVEDVARAFVQSIRVLEHHRSERIRLSRYSVSSGRDIPSTELMSVFETLGHHKPEITYGRPGLPPRRVRPWRGVCVPGWAPKISIEDGIARLLAHHATHRRVAEEA